MMSSSSVGIKHDGVLTIYQEAFFCALRHRFKRNPSDWAAVLIINVFKTREEKLHRVKVMEY